MILFDQNGYPTGGYLPGGAVAMQTTGAGGGASASPKQDPTNVVPNYYEEMAAQRWVPWGNSNMYPVEMLKDFRLNGVASRALDMKCNMLYGKRVVPCRVLGMQEDGQTEILEIVTDNKDINEFLKRSNINEFRNRCGKDFVWLGMVFPMMLLNDDRSKISMVVHDKALKFRFEKFDTKLGRIDHVFRSANWPMPSEAQLEYIKCIDSYQSYLEVDRVRYSEEFKWCFPIRAYDLMNDYYSEVIHESIRRNGWLGNSNDIPAIVRGMIKNVMSIKYHIKIPLIYWDKQYPGFAQMKKEERESIVTAKLKEMNDFLTGKDNQMKAFISHYDIDAQSKEKLGFEIEAMEDKMKYDSWTGVLTAAEASILFAIGVNPAMFGLGSPGGSHTGGANNGGSNIREAGLTMVANSQSDRDALNSWWPFVRQYNGYPDDIELRTFDQVLTTLDTGAGTKKVVS